MAVATPSGGRCREVYTRFNVWTLCRQDQKTGRCRDVSVTGGATVCACSFFFFCLQKVDQDMDHFGPRVKTTHCYKKKAATPDRNEIQ